MDETDWKSDEVFSRVLSAMLEKAPNPQPCSLCGAQEWAIERGITSVPVGATAGNTLSESVIPCVAVTCGNCGHTLFVNALRLGLNDLFDQSKVTSDDRPMSDG